MSLLLFFVFGILASVLALIVEFLSINIFSLSITFEETFSFPIFLSLFVLASIEELMKGVLLFRYRNSIFLQKKIPSSIEKIMYAFSFGSGFSLVEGIFSLQVNTPLSLFPFLQTTFLHIGTSIILLQTFVFSKQNNIFFFSRKNIKYILFAISIHIFFNVIIFFQV